jgi:long-chain acyl-CoA synthetase
VQLRLSERHFCYSDCHFKPSIWRQIWFPEGARSRSTELQEFKPGIGMLLERYPIQVVPVAIYGAHDAYPPRRIVPRPHPIRIAFGEPLDPETLEEEGDGEDAMHRITSALRRHTEELYRRVKAAASGPD